MAEHSYQIEGSNKKKRRKLFLQAFFVFTFFLSLFFLTNSGGDTSEGSYDFLVAQRIIRVGEISFVEKPNYGFTIAPNGKFYNNHEIGNAVFMIPTALLDEIVGRLLAGKVNERTLELIQKFIFSFLASIYFALTLAIYYMILRRHFSLKGKVAFLATLLLGCTTYLWTYIRQMWDGVLCTLLIILALFFLLEFRNSRSLRFYIYCLILLGLAFITRPTTVLVAFAMLGLVTTFVVRGCELLLSRTLQVTKHLLLAGVIFLPFTLWQLYYNWLRTGSPFVTTLASSGWGLTIGSFDGFVQGIVGQLFSPGKSIFVYAPLLILSFLLYPSFHRRHRQEAWFALILTVMWFSLHASLVFPTDKYNFFWTGDWGWGPRYLLTILPIMFLPFSVGLERLLAQRAGRVFVIFLSAFGFMLSIASIITNWHFRMLYLTNILALPRQELYWSFDNNLAIDTLRAAIQNVSRVLTKGQIPYLQQYSDLNSYMSNTLNVWPNAFLFMGVSPLLVGALVFLLLGAMWFSLRALSSSFKDENLVTHMLEKCE